MTLTCIHGKFNTSTRRGKVEVSGNTIYCSVSNFKAYANYKQFFCYQNEVSNSVQASKYGAGQSVLVNKPIAVAFRNGDMLIVDDGEKQFWIHESVVMNNRIYGLGTICFSQVTSYIVQVFNEQFWANVNELSDNIPSLTIRTNIVSDSKKYTTGNYRATSNLNVRSGAGTRYKIKKTYQKGTVFTALEIKDNWARTPSGWVCLDYCVKK